MKIIFENELKMPFRLLCSPSKREKFWYCKKDLRLLYFCAKDNKIGRLWSPCLRVNYVFYGRPKVTLSRSLRRSLMQAFIAAFICISSCIHRWIEVAWIGRASSSKIRFFYEYDWLPKVNTVVIIFSVWLSTHNLSHPLFICTWFLKNQFGKTKFYKLDF